jgi:hypothetical protein
VTDEDERHIRDHYGLFYPLSLPVWLNRGRTKAIVRWSAREDAFRPQYAATR